MSNENRKTASQQNKTDSRRRFFSNRSTQAILLAFSVLEGLIVLRILLKLIGASPESLMVALIYGVTSLFLFPFAGLVQSQTMGSSMVLEVSSMFALVVYALTAMLVEKMITLLSSRQRSSASDTSETATGEHHPIL